MLSIHLARQRNEHCVFFATFLAHSLPHTSIKVSLFGVRSLHIDLGFPHPLRNCPRLQRVVQGIKRVQGSVSAERLPASDHILGIIFQSLDVSCHDHCMFWAACAFAYFGFLRTTEFTVPILASFSPGPREEVGAIASNHRSILITGAHQGFQKRSVPQGLFRSHRACQTAFVCRGCSTCVSGA